MIHNFFSICNAMLCNQVWTCDTKCKQIHDCLVIFCSQFQAFLNLKSWQLLYSWPKKQQHCTSLHSLVIFQHCALDTGWKLSYQFDNGVVMSLPEQKTVSIITCRFSIPSWKKKSNLLTKRRRNPRNRWHIVRCWPQTSFANFNAKTHFYQLLFDVALFSPPK